MKFIAQYYLHHDKMNNLSLVPSLFDPRTLKSFTYGSSDELTNLSNFLYHKKGLSQQFFVQLEANLHQDLKTLSHKERVKKWHGQTKKIEPKRFPFNVYGTVLTCVSNHLPKYPTFFPHPLRSYFCTKLVVHYIYKHYRTFITCIFIKI